MGCCGRIAKAASKAATMAGDLTLTAANVVAHAASTGQIKAEPELVQRRVDTCKKCPHLQNGRCSTCGCYVAAKAGLKVAKCPLSKW